jgi:hypothetical protein
MPSAPGRPSEQPGAGAYCPRHGRESLVIGAWDPLSEKRTLGCSFGTLCDANPEGGPWREAPPPAPILAAPHGSVGTTWKHPPAGTLFDSAEVVGVPESVTAFFASLDRVKSMPPSKLSRKARHAQASLGYDARARRELTYGEDE